MPGAEHAVYRLCPQCFRAVPARSGERYCANDGHALLEGCPACGARITSPYARYCVNCGLNFAGTPSSARLRRVSQVERRRHQT